MYRDLVDCFFRPDRLQTTLHVMILSVNAIHRNALWYVCSKALRHAVAFGFTETGIVPFKESPDIIIPYDFMSKDQLETARQEILRIEQSRFHVCSTKMRTGYHWLISGNRWLIRKSATPPTVVHTSLLWEVWTTWTRRRGRNEFYVAGQFSAV